MDMNGLEEVKKDQKEEKESIKVISLVRETGSLKEVIKRGRERG